jgi:hypothetical protein
MSDPKPVTTSLVNKAPGEALTLEKLREVMEEGQKQVDEINDKLVESLLLAGFRVMINEDLPTGMVAVLPGNFKGSLRRVMEKLRGGDRRFGLVYNLLPPLNMDYMS